ncbi:N-glycosylase/DNA lyase isoform X2 [Chrysoperla carnea]|uniref:N-glycosylase/DNA lyase isoform X2 n=1 Tax=Chrysoperla carnea TaxID=189513 RepID=UPI001D0682CA|nr:N-glycosylase/DNA lyase isoform X2 [Chrysoperla carnea]
MLKMVHRMKEWQKLAVPERDLQLIGTLNGGQSFRWHKRTVEPDEEQWIGVFGSCLWILKQTNTHLFYKVFEAENSNGKRIKRSPLYYESLLKSYFRLDVDIQKLYHKWSECDPIFKKAAENFYGIRLLKQDPVENLFSFICSQNNNINRITSMVEKLCQFYGKEICEIDNKIYYAFPTVDKLAEPHVESELRSANFGYRAKYITSSAEQIVKFGGTEWFDELETMDYKQAKSKLCQLHGIGAKVADCICLMSLNHLEAIPVDTHVYKIAIENYLPQLKKNKTVTEKVYNDIGDHFRELFGNLAGWAHTILFCADLKKLRTDLNQKITM